MLAQRGRQKQWKISPADGRKKRYWDPIFKKLLLVQSAKLKEEHSLEANPDFLIIEQDEDNDTTSPPLNVSSPRSGRLHVSPVRLELFYEEDTAVTTTERTSTETTMNFSTGSSHSKSDFLLAAKSEADQANDIIISPSIAYSSLRSHGTNKSLSQYLSSRMARTDLIIRNKRQYSNLITAPRRYYYTESLEKKISDIETKESIPFLEFSILSLESKLNQALLDLSGRDRTIEELEMQLQGLKENKATDKLVVGVIEESSNSCDVYKEQSDSGNENSQLGEETILFVEESRPTNKEDGTSYMNACTTKEDFADLSLDKKLPDLIISEKEPLQCNTCIAHQNILMEVSTLQKEMQELRRNYRALEVQSRKDILSLSCLFCGDNAHKVDPTTSTELETFLLNNVREQVRSSAESIVLHLTRNDPTNPSADVVRILERKVQHAKDEAERVHKKTEQQNQIFSDAIEKLLWKLRRIDKQRRINETHCPEKYTKKATSLESLDSWSQFSKRFRLALEGKWSPRQDITTLDHLNPFVLSKAKHLLSELSFERDGTPLKSIYRGNGSTAMKQNRYCDNETIGCSSVEVFMDCAGIE
mmetsp:Transcript_8725/g.12719  ORF Transcript_8725/g.12719 Transcript_8725/m.12719 type:complete len:589 (-) Transcript_8725:148-1914(-)